MSDPYLQLQDVRLSRPIGLGGPFVRRKRVEVFTGLDLELPRRGLVLVTGGPGAGKTSLLLLLCGAVKPDAGRLVVDGVEPWKLSRRRRRRVFENNLYLGQNPALWHLAERVGELGEGALRESSALICAIGKDVVIAGLDRWRRLALALGARAALDPIALLLDDPLAGLGPDERGRLLPWLTEQARERLVVVADPGRGFLDKSAAKVVEL